MASPTQWAWVWVNSRSWRWTGWHARGVVAKTEEQSHSPRSALMGRLSGSTWSNEGRSGFFLSRLWTYTVRGTDRGPRLWGRCTFQESKATNSCSLYHSHARAHDLSRGLLIQLPYSKENLNQQTAWGRSSWSLLGHDLPPLMTAEVISVSTAYEALAEFSGFLDKALLLQWHWEEQANKRGNSITFLYCEFSNQWVYKPYKEKHKLRA